MDAASMKTKKGVAGNQLLPSYRIILYEKTNLLRLRHDQCQCKKIGISHVSVEAHLLITSHMTAERVILTVIFGKEEKQKIPTSMS